MGSLERNNKECESIGDIEREKEDNEKIQVLNVRRDEGDFKYI